ncbi:MAG: N-6 DNA methylase, partial [Planctomycetes bacterium]|nr:N-6 DNA methylase [Planctomycetota bacterium]
MTQELKRKQDLGQFFTPPEVVEFIYDILSILLKNNKKWNNGKHPSIIDPACGDGVFLKIALDKEITQPKYIFGIDIDESVKQRWEEINLLKSFGSHAELDNHFYHQNGLLPLPDKTLRYKKGGLQEFDLVVGNPPYGGLGVDLTKNSVRTADALKDYQVLSYRGAVKNVSNTPKEQKEMFLVREPQAALSLKTYDTDIMKSVPIEVYFVERFIQLAKPGGHIAIIIPEGILANATLEYVRKFIADNVKIEAVISLPRGTFKTAGTSAKTSILVLSKPLQEGKIDLNYPVFLVEVTD